ncbi:inorganic phosphate transporter [Clostridia bacterium]|nr:inorganic phosphate transporter [Clostridia bacterium]
MTISFLEFIGQMLEHPVLFISVVLSLGVILINGWIDVPNSIATCVATRALPVKQAIVLAAVFDFIGVFVMTSINASVSRTIFYMVDFSGEMQASMISLCAAMLAIVIWSISAWSMGIPSSEGHALIAGISGAAIALQGGWSGIIWSEWVKVLYGLIIAVIVSFSLGLVITRLIESLFFRVEKRKTTFFFKRAQIAGAAMMAFLHGAQDGQKFMGIFLLQVFLVQGYGANNNLGIPIWLMLLCSVVMATGTFIGGYRIIKSLGMNVVHLTMYQGLSADIASSITILASTFLGIPVSTTHVKATAIVGVGVSNKASSVNWYLVKDMVLTWILTFPGCALLSYGITWLFLHQIG